MNYYEILGVNINAKPEEIKSAYLKKIKQFHPDIYNGDKEFAEKQTELINEAYTTLKDKNLKEKYNLKNNIISNQPKKVEKKKEQVKTNSSYDEFYKKYFKKSSKAKQPVNINNTTITENIKPKKKKKEKPVKPKTKKQKQRIKLDIAITILIIALFFLVVIPLIYRQ